MRTFQDMMDLACVYVEEGAFGSARAVARELGQWNLSRRLVRQLQSFFSELDVLEQTAEVIS